MCSQLCYEILKCCNHRSSSTQVEASALLYFFMRKNFDFTKGKSIVRSHLQVGSSRGQQACCECFSIPSLFPTALHLDIA